MLNGILHWSGIILIVGFGVCWAFGGYVLNMYRTPQEITMPMTPPEIVRNSKMGTLATRAGLLGIMLLIIGLNIL